MDYAVTVAPGGAVFRRDGGTVDVTATVDTVPPSDANTITMSFNNAVELQPLGTKAAKAQYIANKMVDVYIESHPLPPAPPQVLDLSGTITITR